MSTVSSYCPCGGNVHSAVKSIGLTASDEGDSNRPVLICENCGYIFCEKHKQAQTQCDTCPYCGSFAAGSSYPILLNSMFVPRQSCNQKVYRTLAGPIAAKKMPSESLFYTQVNGGNTIRLGSLTTTPQEQSYGVLPEQYQRESAEEYRDFLISNVERSRAQHRMLTDDDKDFFGATVEHIDAMLCQRDEEPDCVEIHVVPSRRGVLNTSFEDMEDVDSGGELLVDEPIGE